MPEMLENKVFSEVLNCAILITIADEKISSARLIWGKNDIMNKISLCTEGNYDMTIVPNAFIDDFMPSANGAYVKVYLYLLRCLQSNDKEITISLIADRLDHTEKDILRALHYWEKMNILKLKLNEQKEISGIHLLNITKSQNNNQAMVNNKGIEEDEAGTDELAVSLSEVKPVAAKGKAAAKTEEPVSHVDIQGVYRVVELYLEQPLRQMDFELINYLYEQLHFSPELIMYLYEYCISKSKKNISYIEAVALAWAKEGIDTEEKAREYTVSYDEHFSAVNKAFGLGRAPSQIERQYITKWVEVFSFTDEIITEACNRTILRTQKPDFKYANKILETWFKKGAKTMADIARLDEEFSKGNKGAAEYKNSTTVKPTGNKLNQFPKREYSSNDYAELERKLLNKGL